MLTGLPWDSFEITPMGFSLLSSGEVALPAASWIGSWLFLAWPRSHSGDRVGKRRTCFWRREGVFCGNSEQLFFILF